MAAEPDRAMTCVEQQPPPDTRSTEVSFDVALWELVVGEAARHGVSIADYVRDAAVARAAFGLRARGGGPDDLLAGWARTLLDHEDDVAGTGDARQKIVNRARERCADAIALGRESVQARRQGKALGAANVILDTAVAMVTGVLERSGLELAAPVVASFRDVEHGTGIEVEVKLRGRSRVDAARAALAERFGDRSRVDVIRVS